MNALARSIPQQEHFDVAAALASSLAVAHKSIEKRFSRGASALVNIMTVLQHLTRCMDNLTSALNGETANATSAGIRAARDRLAPLPEVEARRGERFCSLERTCASLSTDIEGMREIMRYLRTFAVTARITGAELPSFTAFAEEISARILEGATSVDQFATRLGQMGRQLSSAGELSGKVAEQYQAHVPGILGALNDNIAAIEREHRVMSELAAETKLIADSVRAKVAGVLSSLQTGDITRQRIEHITSMLEIAEDFVAATPDLSADAAEQMRSLVQRLAARQLSDTIESFSSGCGRVVLGMSGFTNDAQSLLAVRDKIVAGTDGQKLNALQVLNQDLMAATALVSGLVETSQKADVVAAESAENVGHLLEGIQLVRQIEVDIHYMALNSTLRCSRLGEAGLPVNVVSSELRAFAALLEDPAQRLVAALAQVEGIAQSLAVEHANEVPIIEPIMHAQRLITSASEELDRNMEEFASAGQEVFGTITAAIQELDFETELGDALRDCEGIVRPWQEHPALALSDLDAATLLLGERIFSHYTMMEERQIHREFFPQAEEIVADHRASGADEDELEDLLF